MSNAITKSAETKEPAEALAILNGAAETFEAMAEIASRDDRLQLQAKHWAAVAAECRTEATRISAQP